MNISVIGSGYVGATLSGCLADLGHDITAVDIDDAIVERINAGDTPIEEPRLQELYDNYVGETLQATTDYDVILDTDVTFLTVQTPARENGSIDLSAVLAATESLGETLAEKECYHLVVVKSTVIPGMVEERIIEMLEEASDKTVGEGLGIAVNPEFQSQGSAVEDFLNADKVVLGTNDDEQALALLRRLYEPLVADSDIPIVETGLREAAMIKYANNAFLASKISLINEIGNICKEYEVDAYEVADAIGLDERIGEQFLRTGVGWGGSCFPKDTNALIAAAGKADYDAGLLQAVVDVNEIQPLRMLELLDRHVDIAGKRVAVLGLAFKPGTDDIRGTRAVPLIKGLLDRGAEVMAYDPVATENMQDRFPEIEYANSAAAALDNAYGALVVTDWDEFAVLNEEFNAMAEPIVVDGRRIIERREEIIYEGLTW